MSGAPEVPQGVRPSMVEMREFRRQRWRLWALGKYCDLLVRLAARDGLTAGLADRCERAIAEAECTQLWLDRRVDDLATQ